MIKTLSPKKTLCFIFAAVGLSVACQKDNPTPPPSKNINLKNGLLVYLPFNGNVADSSGNSNTTTIINGGSLTYDEHGYSNSAFGGTGNGEKVVVNNNGSIKFDTAFSVSFDFMIRDFGVQNLVSMVDNLTSKGATFALGPDLPNNQDFIFGVTDSTSTCDAINQSYNTTFNQTSFKPQPESWYNIVAIYHLGVQQIFANGKLVSTQTGIGTKAHICPNSQFIVGGWSNVIPTSINGKIDEVRLYNRVLNSDEIAELSKEFQ